ncbi:hypothetical protein GCM10010195_58060 [Kitasatospora griseola]|nr:hypothetical protein GCM10010195_58060 [Kitasatospora griseola]
MKYSTFASTVALMPSVTLLSFTNGVSPTSSMIELWYRTGVLPVYGSPDCRNPQPRAPFPPTVPIRPMSPTPPEQTAPGGGRHSAPAEQQRSEGALRRTVFGKPAGAARGGPAASGHSGSGRVVGGGGR